MSQGNAEFNGRFGPLQFFVLLASGETLKMIKYHGTPCGGRREDVARFLAGRHAMVPFEHDKNDAEDVCTAAEVCDNFVVDNGAFSAWRSGNAVTDWSAYYAFVDEWRRHQAFEWAVIPDVIDGDETANDDLLADWPFEECGVPVWHLNESIGRLERLVAAYPRVALGSSGEFADPGTRAWWGRMAEAMAVIVDERQRPRTKLHGLRMLDPAIFHRLPLASADSTNAAMNGSRTAKRCGCNVLTGNVIIAQRIEAHQSASEWVETEKQRVLLWE